MAKNWVPIRLKTERAKMKHVQARVTGWADEVIQKGYFPWLQQLMAAAADVGREYIGSAAVSTRTGQREGRRGRVKTGEMQKGFTWNYGEKVKDGDKYRFRVGWINGTPGYSIFQEHGVQGGVVGMNAIGYVTEFLRTEIRVSDFKFSKSATRVRTSSAWTDGGGNSGA